MRSFLQRASKAAVLFLCGGAVYALLETVWRGHTHWTMAVMGGVLFLLIGGMNNWLPWDMSLILQVGVGTAMVTAVEFAAGLILNVWLGLGIWDYSGLPGNILGQICPQFTVAWAGLSLVAILLDDYLRYLLWDEEKPQYKLF